MFPLHCSSNEVTRSLVKRLHDGFDSKTSVGALRHINLFSV